MRDATPHISDVANDMHRLIGRVDTLEKTVNAKRKHEDLWVHMPTHAKDIEIYARDTSDWELINDRDDVLVFVKRR